MCGKELDEAYPFPEHTNCWVTHVRTKEPVLDKAKLETPSASD